MVALLYIPLSGQSNELSGVRLVLRHTPFEETQFTNARKEVLREVPDAIMLWNRLEVFK